MAADPAAAEGLDSGRGGDEDVDLEADRQRRDGEMADNVYAVLVGIDAYPPAVAPLQGCRNDAEAVEAFLRGRVPPEALHIETLLDADATRQRIIEAFSGHLAQAGPGDVALFFFAGHGSYEVVEERFWFLEPSGTNQTLVCADRSAAAPDLADKELAALIDEVAADGPHVLVVLDCCHSGGGTRDVRSSDGVRVRQAPPVEEPRAMAAYLPAVRDAATRHADASVAPARSGQVDAITARWLDGGPRHVALSACESHQLSKELSLDGRPRGVFTAALLRALETLGPASTYRQLIGAASLGVRERVADQHPVAYATERSDLDAPLFGGVVRSRTSGLTLEHSGGSWWLDAGQVHGLQQPTDGETTVLAVLHPDAPDEDAESQVRGHARVVEVQLTRSRVEPIDWEPDTGARHAAVVVEVPLPPASVELAGDAAGTDLLREHLSDSPHVEERDTVTEAGGDHFRVLAAADFVITRADGTPLTDAVPATAEGAAATARRLDHLARWHLCKRLDNPLSALAGKVEIELVVAERGTRAPPPGTLPTLSPDSGGDLRLRYRRNGLGWEPPHVFIYLHNRSDRDLYCSLLNLTDRFRCHSLLFPMDRIPAGKSAVALEGRAIDVAVPAERIAAGWAEVQDWLKLLASEERFEPDAFALPNLDGALPHPPMTRDHRPRSTIDRLARRVADRDLGGEALSSAPEWTTAIVSLVTERPPDGAALSATSTATVTAADAGGVVSIVGHPALLDARASLGTVEHAFRSPEGRDPAPPLLVRDPAVAVPLLLSGARSALGALDHLELHGDLAADRVTSEDPLRLRLHLPVPATDLVLAVAREGDLFLPLGLGTSQDGSVELNLERLPAGVPTDPSTRGPGRSVRIFFQRILGQRLGVDPGWPRLTIARTRAAGDAAAEAVELSREHVAAALRDARRVLLVVPGVFSDPLDMVVALQQALPGAYDAVIAFEFDSIGTTVEDNATALAELLSEAGVTEEQGRRLDVVAHSVGALIVRWWAERAGGAPLIQRAVLTGVPNAGTPWAKIKGLATTAAALGLNGLTTVVWPARVLGAVIAGMERLDRGLDELQPGSATLTSLGRTGQQAPAYTVLVGQGSVPPASLSEHRGGRTLQLLERLGRAAATVPFLSQPNDLVVAAASARALPASLSPQPAFVDVPCDHFTYLSQPSALAAIAAALPSRGADQVIR
jgi:hypothetical protein